MKVNPEFVDPDLIPSGVRLGGGGKHFYYFKDTIIWDWGVLFHSVLLTGCCVSDLHTGECIHGCYFIAGPSIHTVGDVQPFAEVSMFCSNKEAGKHEKRFQWEMLSLNYLPSSGMFSLPFPGKRRAPLSSSKWKECFWQQHNSTSGKNKLTNILCLLKVKVSGGCPEVWNGLNIALTEINQIVFLPACEIPALGGWCRWVSGALKSLRWLFVEEDAGRRASPLVKKNVVIAVCPHFKWQA